MAVRLFCCQVPPCGSDSSMMLPPPPVVVVDDARHVVRSHVRERGAGGQWRAGDGGQAVVLPGAPRRQPQLGDAAAAVLVDDARHIARGHQRDRGGARLGRAGEGGQAVVLPASRTQRQPQLGDAAAAVLVDDPARLVRGHVRERGGGGLGRAGDGGQVVLLPGSPWRQPQLDDVAEAGGLVADRVGHRAALEVCTHENLLLNSGRPRTCAAGNIGSRFW